MLSPFFIAMLAGLTALATANAQSGAIAAVRARLSRSTDSRTFPGALENPRGETLEIAGPHARFTGAFVNRGIFKITDTTVTFGGTYTELGSYVSDPSTNYFTNLVIGTTGALTGGTGDVFVVSGNFLNGSLQNAAWSTGAAELWFSANASHSVSLAGADLGPTALGYVNNFAWGILRVEAGQALALSDGNATPGGALYVQQLILDGGVAQIASFTGNGFNIYYNPANAANAYLGGLTYPLTGGGAIIPVTATLKITSISRLANGHISLQCLGFPGVVNTVQFSPDLVTSFALLASVTAAADGTFQFEDVNAPNFTKRFYRLKYP